MNKWRFNKKFLKEKIAEGKLVLQTCDKNTDIYQDAKIMVDHFEIALGKKEETPIKKKKVDTSTMINNLDKIFNEALRLISLEDWESLKNVCQYIPKFKFNNTNSNLLPNKDLYVVEASLDLFKRIDHQAYDAALKIVYNDQNLINILNKNDIDNNYCWFCNYLDLPFVNVSAKHDCKYIFLAHELRHAINFYLYGSINSNLIELPSIYSEMLMADYINKYYNCPKLYYDRINYISNQTKRLVPYIDILMRFDEAGRKLTIDNFDKVLDVRNNEDRIKKYALLTNRVHLSLYNYIVSTLISTFFREEYHNGNKKIVNEKMEQLLLSTNYKLNYNKLEDKYIDYLKEVKTLSKK